MLFLEYWEDWWLQSGLSYSDLHMKHVVLPSSQLSLPLAIVNGRHHKVWIRSKCSNLKHSMNRRKLRICYKKPQETHVDCTWCQQTIDLIVNQLQLTEPTVDLASLIPMPTEARLIPIFLSRKIVTTRSEYTRNDKTSLETCSSACRLVLSLQIACKVIEQASRFGQIHINSHTCR